MKRGWLINSQYYNLSNFNSNFFLKNFGIKLFFLKRLEHRLELTFLINSRYIISSQWISLIKTLYLIIPNSKSFKKKRLLNIYYLDLISSYRGWRHSKGLPVRGQRTWTNAWSTYKSNLILREYRVEVSKRIYGSIQLNYLSVAYLAEQINSLWKIQWEKEWKVAKKKRYIQTQNENNIQKIDLLSMSKGIVGKHGKSKEKQKKKNKQSYISLGFEPGFVKALLKVKFLKNQTLSKKNKTMLIFEKGVEKKKAKVKLSSVKKIVKKKKLRLEIRILFNS